MGVVYGIGRRRIRAERIVSITAYDHPVIESRDGSCGIYRREAKIELRNGETIYSGEHKVLVECVPTD